MQASRMLEEISSSLVVLLLFANSGLIHDFYNKRDWQDRLPPHQWSRSTEVFKEDTQQEQVYSSMSKQWQTEWWQIIIVSYKFFKIVFSLPGWEINDIFKSSNTAWQTKISRSHSEERFIYLCVFISFPLSESSKHQSHTSK